MERPATPETLRSDLLMRDDDDDGTARLGMILLGVTLALAAVGIALYEAGEPGWAQSMWILASGTAGAGVISWLDR